jgi:hypothetical protein
MSFTITDQAILQQIYDAFHDQNWSLSYQLDFEALTDAQGGPKAGVDPAVYIWIEGARKVNANTGEFADYIRDYTARQ